MHIMSDYYQTERMWHLNNVLVCNCAYFRDLTMYHAVALRIKHTYIMPKE